VKEQKKTVKEQLLNHTFIWCN